VRESSRSIFDEADTQAAAAELATPTLAELYFEQGIHDKAVEVYKQIVQREPDNAKAASRLGEIEALRTAAAVPPPPAGAPPAAPADRAEAVRRVIGQLEGWLSVIERSRP